MALVTFMISDINARSRLALITSHFSRISFGKPSVFHPDIWLLVTGYDAYWSLRYHCGCEGIKLAVLLTDEMESKLILHLLSCIEECKVGDILAWTLCIEWLWSTQNTHICLSSKWGKSQGHCGLLDAEKLELNFPTIGNGILVTEDTGLHVSSQPLSPTGLKAVLPSKQKTHNIPRLSWLHNSRKTRFSGHFPRQA